MSVGWYIQVMGQVVGPMTDDALRKAAASGQVRRDSTIRHGENGQWVLAEMVTGLFPPLPPSREAGGSPARPNLQPAAPQVRRPAPQQPAPQPIGASALAPAPTVPESPDDIEIERRSSWSRLLYFCAALCFLAAALGALVGFLSIVRGVPEGLGFGGALFMTGLITGFQFMFSKFLLDVFTDIRWYLKRILDRTPDGNR